MIGPRRHVKLRRTPLAVLLGANPYVSVPVLFVVGFSIWAFVDERNPAWLIAAIVLSLYFVRAFVLSVSLRGRFVFEQTIFTVPHRTPIAEIIRVPVGVAIHRGVNTYHRGFVMMIETAAECRVLPQSYFCGRRRLERWAQQIADHPDFVGDVEVTSGVIYETPEPRRR